MTPNIKPESAFHTTITSPRSGQQFLFSIKGQVSASPYIETDQPKEDRHAAASHHITVEVHDGQSFEDYLLLVEVAMSDAI